MLLRAICSIFKVIFIVLVVIGCSKSKDEKPEWQEVIDEIATDGDPLFSLMFVDPPPEGTGLKIHIFNVLCDEPCALFAGEEGCDDRDLWVLNVIVGRQVPGIYKIKAANEYEELEDREYAQAELVQVKDLNQETTYPALSGSVEIIDAPYDAKEWHEGKELSAVIRAEFPTEVLHEVECNSWGDDKNYHEECICEDDEGNQSKCTPAERDGFCCYDPDSPRYVFEKEIIKVRQCADACAVVDNRNLERYCIELQ